MKVRKENRVLTVDEADKAFYLSEGYEVVELAEDGKSYEVVEQATGGKTYTIAEYAAVVDERDTLKKKVAEYDVVIEERDALQAKVKELETKLAASAKDDFDREAVKAKLNELGIEFKGNASNEVLKQKLDEATKGDGE